MWNFNGFGSFKAQTIKKADCEFFNKLLECNDLVCFSETWRDPVDTLLFNLNNQFSEYHEPGYKNHLGAGLLGVCLSLFANQFQNLFPLFFQIVTIFGAK